MDVLNAGCLLQRRGKKEVQEKQDLRNRVGMDIEDGWHLHKHMNAHVHSPTRVLRSSEGTKHKRNGLNVGCGGLRLV